MATFADFLAQSFQAQDQTHRFTPETATQNPRPARGGFAEFAGSPEAANRFSQLLHTSLDQTGVFRFAPSFGPTPTSQSGQLSSAQKFSPITTDTLAGVKSWLSGLGASPAPTALTSDPTAKGMTDNGGDWAGVDQWDQLVQQASGQTGVPANLLKAVMKLESDGNPAAGGAPGVVGLMQINTSGDAWGYGPWATDNGANILKGAQILSDLYHQFGDWGEALRHYHGIGSDGNTTDTQYRDIILGYWNQLNGLGGTTKGPSPTTSAAGNQVLSIAESYVGVPYVWGGIPGKGDNPWDTGWDCSGFTYWLDQSYGTGSLPMGSHYQYQYAQQTGKLFTDVGQLQPGDLVFFDTGFRGGAGSDLNGASHVALYIGDGKMLHAANPSTGTIVSNLQDYIGQYQYLGAMHMSWSGGASGFSGQPATASRTTAGNWWGGKGWG